MEERIVKKTRLYRIAAILIWALFIGTVVHAANLPAADSKLINTAGVPIFSGATFVNGNQDVGFRFATSKSLEDVRSWYATQLPSWSLYKEYGGWILYDGKPGLDMGELMIKNQVSVQTNEQLHEWFGLDKAMSTEIVIMLPSY
jgi:hypothetical protein